MFDFRALIGGRQFLVNVELGRNGNYMKTLAHIDGGANIFGAIKTSLSYLLSKRFHIPFIKLPKPIVPTGYNGKPGTPITVAILLTLTIDRRRINFPFLVTDLGHTDVLIGRKFLEHYDLKQSYAKDRNRLEWPLDMPIIPYHDQRILVDIGKLQGPVHRSIQSDVERRDALIDADDHRRKQAKLASVQAKQLKRPPRDLLKPSRASSFFRDMAKRLKTMEDHLLGRHPSTLSPSEDPPPTKRGRPAIKTSLTTDICMISAAAMSRLYLRDERKAATFVASVHDIDSELTRRRKETLNQLSMQLASINNDLSVEEAMEVKYQSDEEMVQKKLPAQYKEFESLFSRRDSDSLPEHKPNVDHKIDLIKENVLSFEPLRRMTDEQLSETKKYIVDNLHKGFIEPSNAPYAAPILFAKKADGGLRFCVDYRKLNELTKKDPYPIPLIDEMMARICQAKIFTKLDIQQAFHRIRMTTDSEDYTTFRTRYGTYKYKVLPFGLTNGPATFQRFINDILMEHLDDFCSAYMDDILIYSSNTAEHELHVKKIMTILQAHGLQADIKKSEFGVKKTKFLGFIVGVNGVEVDPEKISVIHKWQYAENVRGVQSYLGFCNFYRRFIKDYSRIARPLTALTGKDVTFAFDQKCKDAWETLRAALQSAPILRHYDPLKQTRLETDSSDGVIAGVLSQLQEDGHFHPVGYFSKTMGDAELNYPIHDKELLAIFRSFKHYRPEILGAQKSVHVYTDHRALEYFMTTKDLSARQARWAEFFADFHFTIMYRAGVTNTLADTLSRRDQDISPLEARKRALRSQQMIPTDKIDPRVVQELQLAAVNTPDEFEDVNSYLQVVNEVQLAPADATLEDSLPGEEEMIDGEATDPTSMIAYDIDGYEVIDRLLSANKTSVTLEPLREKARNHALDYELRHDKLYFQGRLEVPLEPPELRTALIRHVHDQPAVAHAGISKMKLLMGRKYHWNGMTTDITRYIANCRCSRMKARRDKTPGFLHPLPIPARPYQHLTMDFTELPPDADGYDFAFVVVDRLSKKPLSLPCHRDITAKGMAKLFLANWTRHFGMPDSIVSDRGAQFVSTFWREYCRILGTKVKLTTAYNPNVDGQTEVMNQYIKQRLRPFCSYYQDDWSGLLPIMDIAQLTLPHESLGNLSPFQLLNGNEPRTSFDLQRPEPPTTATERLNKADALKVASRMNEVITFAQSSLQSQQDKMKRLADRSRRQVDWDVGDMVMVDTRNWRLDRPSRKLSDKWYGPVEVLERVGESWEVRLPAEWKIHPVFHSHSLRKYVDNPLPGQTKPVPAPLQILPEQDEWEITEILGAKKVNAKLFYKIKWKGADEDLNWYPCSDAMTAPHMLKSFHLKNPQAKGPPRSLLKWLEAYNTGRDDYSDLEDDHAMTSTARTQFFERGG